MLTGTHICIWYKMSSKFEEVPGCGVYAKKEISFFLVDYGSAMG